MEEQKEDGMEMPGTPDSMPSLEEEGVTLAEETIVIDPEIMYREVTVDGEVDDVTSMNANIQQTYRERKFEGLTNVYRLLHLNRDDGMREIERRKRQIGLLTHPDSMPRNLSEEAKQAETKKRDHLNMLASTAVQLLTHQTENGERAIKGIYDLGLDLEQGTVREDDPRLAKLYQNHVNALLGLQPNVQSHTATADPDDPYYGDL